MMKKMKKLLAVLLTMVMVMGLGIGVFAAVAPDKTASITVIGLTANDNTVLKLYQVVELDVENSTWKVTDWVKNIEKEEEITYVDLSTTPITIAWASLSEKVPESAPVKTYTLEAGETSYKFENLAVGAYMIKATGDTTTYNVMGEGTYNYDDDSNLIVPVDKTISAKGSTYQVTKTLQDSSKTFVAKGDTVVFDITTVFPSYPDSETNRVFTITDTPAGMKITGVKVFVNNNELTLNEDYEVSELNVADQAVTVKFTSEFIGTDNEHATESVKVEVTAIVTSDNAYSNKAETNKSSNPSEVEGDVGSLKIKKVDENEETLEGAKFEIVLGNEVLKFAPTNVPGEYILVAGGTDTAETDVALVESPESGTIKITGLGAGTYEITETEAPAGYSTVEVSDVTIEEGENADVEIEVINTKLVALPSTGGIGTTIFTVVGCLIMIAAAGMFFANKRRA